MATNLVVAGLQISTRVTKNEPCGSRLQVRSDFLWVNMTRFYPAYTAYKSTRAVQK